MNPTSSQVHLALATLRMLKETASDTLYPPSFFEQARNRALDIIKAATTNPGWTGLSDDCEAFGACLEKGEAEITRLSEMVVGLSAQNADFIEFLKKVCGMVKVPDAVNIEATRLLERYQIPR